MRDFEFRISNFGFLSHPPFASGTGMGLEIPRIKYRIPAQQIADCSGVLGIENSIRFFRRWWWENSKFEIRNPKSGNGR